MPGSTRRYSFGPYVLDPGRGVLFRRGVRVALTPRTLHLLAVLVEHAGEPLDKDELIRLVWGNTVVEENNLARQISSLRKALGESPSQREYIATVPGLGYQFVAPVAAVDDPGEHVPTPGRGIGQPVLLAAGVVLAVAMLGGTVAVRRGSPASATAPPVQRSMEQLTFGGGLQQDPAWSPDGSRIAFASDRAGDMDVWLQAIGDLDATRVTTSPAREWQPSWSPDGRRLVFRSEQDGGGLFVVSVDGGEPHRIASFGDRPQWAPDGDAILFTNATVRTGARKLFVVSADGGEPREILGDVVARFVSSDWLSAVDAAWHPDGRRISIWGRVDGRWTFVTAPVSGSDRQAVYSSISDAVLRDLDATPLRLARFVWAPSGRFVYFEGQSGETRNVWRVEIDPATLAWIGAPERLTMDVGEETDIALSPDGTRLAFTVRSQRTRVWSLGFDPRQGRIVGEADALTAGSAGHVGVDTLEDGSRLAYRSARAGRTELRELRTADREDRILLVSNGSTPSSPRWSADGRRLAYARRGPRAGRNVVAILSADKREEQVLSLPDQTIFRPSDWSADGRTLLGDCRTAPGESMGICTMPAPGNGASAGAPRVLVHDDARHLFGPRFSPDKRWISFVAVETKGATTSRVHVVPADGGPWIPITDGTSFDDKPRWARDGRAIYFVSDRTGYLNLNGRRFDPVAGTPVGELFAVTSFDSPRRGLPSTIAQIEFAVARHRLFLPLTDTEAGIWTLDGVDR